ncbi:MAG: Cna B-type domain-containing protein [Oscillospiraceae bacterium]|jgi:hypothetical protein
MKVIRQKRWIAVLLCLLLCVTLLSMTGLAAGEKTASLTVEYLHSNVNFQLYHVAVPSETWYTATEAFSNYAVSLDASNSGDWCALASTLAAYAARDSVTPTALAVTDDSGRALFSDLAAGLYLVMGSTYTKDNIRYVPTPFVVAVKEGEALTVNTKYDKPGNTYADYTVKKVWKDVGNTKARPASVTVQLLKDGIVYDTAVLDANHGWKHTWKYLDSSANWQVAETDMPKGYTVKITQEQNTFTVTNTYAAASSKPVQPKPNNPSIPKTGDASHIVFYVGLYAVSFLVLILLVIPRKKSGQRER